MDVAAFLSQYHPFDGLDGDQLAAVAGSVLIEFFPAGTRVLEQTWRTCGVPLRCPLGSRRDP